MKRPQYWVQVEMLDMGQDSLRGVETLDEALTEKCAITLTRHMCETVSYTLPEGDSLRAQPG